MIIEAAIKIGEKIVSGYMIHACVLVEAFELGLMPKPKIEQMEKSDWQKLYFEIGYEEGFLTNCGKFLDRAEALEYSLSNGQLESRKDCYREGELHFPDIYFQP